MLLLLAIGTLHPAHGAHAASTPQTPSSFARRVEAASRRYLGTPYRLMPLGEGNVAAGSPKPLFDERHVDCVTFVEQSLAHAIARRPAQFLPILQRIRYRDGQVRFDRRNHFTLADWAPNNRWFEQDVTRAVGGKWVQTATKRLDRTLPARENQQPGWGARLAADHLPGALRVTYIPRSAAPSVATRFPPASIVAFVSPHPGMDASHVGFVFRGAHGLVLRHASSLSGRVVDMPFLPYLARRRTIPGVVVLAMRNDARISPAGP